MAARPATLEARLGHVWQDRELLVQALTHRSAGTPHYERLEFLGDGVLNCVIGTLLYERFPELPEGRLSRLRANLVNQETLHAIALQLDLGRYLHLGEGELKSGGSGRPSILADAVESLLGAIFLDAGFEAARGLVERLFAERMTAIDPAAQGKDAKTRLQEWLQGRGLALPRYHVVSIEGESHAQVFEVSCAIEALHLKANGSGVSRRRAEQVAAQALLTQLPG